MVAELKLQKAKVGVAGSFINQMMANNASLPEVGKGATQLHSSDRTCFEVIEVSQDGKEVKLEVLDPQINPEYLAKLNGRDCAGHQNWVLNPTGRFITVVWRNNAWKVKSNVVRFIKEFQKQHEGASLARQLTPEQRLAVYGGNVWPQNVVEGFTEAKVEYSTIKILFGVKDYYYDWYSNKRVNFISSQHKYSLLCQASIILAINQLK